MEDCLARLRFTTDYVGVIRIASCPNELVHGELKHHPKAEFLYLQNAEEALWLGFSGEHIDPLARWFLSAHRVLRCSSTVAAVLATKIELPTGRIDALLIDRAAATPEVFDGFIQTNYAIYLAHSDEFLVFVPESRKGIPAKAVKERIAGLERCRTVEKAPVEEEAKPAVEQKREPYDPIFKQIQEVTDTIGASATQAASDLVRDWLAILRAEPPKDIQQFEDEIDHTISRIKGLSSNPQDDILPIIDDLAMSLRAKRRAAFGLLSNIRDFEWPPSPPTMTYERAATSLMLRAVKRYAAEVARKLDVDDYEFMPVVGQDFDVHPGLFSTQHPAHTTYSTVLLEFPAEIRLRLGALPVIAHQIARMRERDLEHIADLIAAKEKSADLRWLFRGSPGKRFATEEGRERHQHSVREMGKQLAADLLAVAAIGPQYVFAIARFAIGTLGDFGAEVQQRNHLTLSARIAACLGYLGEISPKFQSPYFRESDHRLPQPVLDIVGHVVRAHDPDEHDITRVMDTLRDGRIVLDASPTVVLAALWKGVVRRSGYLHEIAALISIAASE